MKGSEKSTMSYLTSRLAGLPGWQRARGFFEAAAFRPKSRSEYLRNNDLVVILGGGPAGSFFALRLLREARDLNRHIDVVVIEKRSPLTPGGDSFPCRGCNYCAGGISPRLHEALRSEGIVIPEEVIQGHIDYIWIQGHWKNFRLRVPRGMQMYSVFRGSLPGRRSGAAEGFDAFLLGEAVKAGAQILHGAAESMIRAETGMPRVTVRLPSRECISLDASFVAVATGINGHFGFDYGNDGLMASVQRLNPAFLPGKSRKAFIFELDVGEDYLERNMRREIHFIEYRSKLLDLEHTALLPKGKFLTVAMIGRCIDETAAPGDGQRIVREFLKLPHIERILPGIAEAPIACACFPRMTVAVTRHGYGDRFAVIGDAVGARLNKDGLFSAHMTASRLAKTVLRDGIDEQALARGYGETIQWLAADNRSGRIVFGLSRMAFTRPMISRVIYQAFATELKVREEQNRPVGTVLWKIASGTADYREVLREMCGVRVLLSILLGVAVTLRNMVIEALLGLAWGDNGRYPTVVLKEKRQRLKRLLASSLGAALAEAPDFERMYVIKIRGSGEEIIEELAKFGQPEAKFLNLRFVEVRQIQGVPNQGGSVIRYRIPWLAMGAKLRLARRIGFQTLLYELDHGMVDNGMLVFNVAPTMDGNRRLSIYAAFDYRKGRSLAGRLLRRIAQVLFPGFVHDIVWNHALCAIKEEVEWKHTHPRREQMPVLTIRKQDNANPVRRDAGGEGISDEEAIRR